MNESAHNAPAFHAGERTMQASVGLAERMAQVGKLGIRDYMPEQHREFFPLLPFVIVGSIDTEARPSASVLAAPPGFVSTPDPQLLRIAALPDADDPLAANLRIGASLGVLGIQPHTRRRNRANGVVSALDEHGFDISIRQSFGNCPKYIQAREAVFGAQPEIRPAARINCGLDDDARALIASADTFYIASSHVDAGKDASRAEGVDVSHRGGPPGFIGVDGDELWIPDYRGNFFFNTMGNLLLNPQAGLLFIDFHNGDLLHVDASARIVIEAPSFARLPVAERLLHLVVHRSTFRPRALPLNWGPLAQQERRHMTQREEP